MAPPKPTQGYAPPAERPPLLSYTVLMGAFGALFSDILLVHRRGGRELPERIGASDLALLGVASHKVSRLVSKDKVTAPLRAPFTHYEGQGGPSELEESSRGSGARKAIGDLLVCPYCLGLWVVAAFALGLRAVEGFDFEVLSERAAAQRERVEALRLRAVDRLGLADLERTAQPT